MDIVLTALISGAASGAWLIIAIVLKKWWALLISAAFLARGLWTLTN